MNAPNPDNTADNNATNANSTFSEELGYFKYDHLPEKLQEISRPFSELAHIIAGRGGSVNQTRHALQKLVEAKDCAVRAAL